MENIPYEVLQQGGFVGPRFTGVFLFERVLWRVAIPIVMGTRSVNALDALRMMPPETRQLLSLRHNDLREYLKLWADCFDYDLGYQVSAKTAARESFLNEMIESTERELTSAVADLCQQRPNSNAVHSSRDATEKALKAYLCHYGGLTQDVAKGRFGHNLNKLVQEVRVRTPQSPLVLSQDDLGVFVPYDDRYTSKRYELLQLWGAYRTAQFVAAEVLRSITGKNMLGAVLRDPVFLDSAAEGRALPLASWPK